MSDRTFEQTDHKSRLLQSTGKDSPLASAVENYHPLISAINRFGNTGSVSNDAAVLQRAPSLAQHSLLHLQKDYGNHYVQRVIAQAKYKRGSCTCCGGYPPCQEQELLQTKLKINELGDNYEREADRIADQVMRMPESWLQHQVDEEEEKKLLQTKPLVQRQVADDDGGSEAPPIVQEVLRSPGQPLQPDTRTFMEMRFGRDLSQVRVHTDSKAAESAHAVNALAYTVGQDLVFGAGQYAPHLPKGRWLLAHELTHSQQQAARFPPSNALRLETPHPAERETDHKAHHIAKNQRISPVRQLQPYVARFSVRGHHIIEQAALSEAGFSPKEIESIHQGNVERDFSQVGRVLNTLLLCKPSKLGGYKAVEHFDNFIWDATNNRWRTRGTGRRFRHEDLNTPDPTPINYIETELMTLSEQGMSDGSLIHLGNAFHTVEDFFAHSNFVELIDNDFSLGRDLITGSVSGTDSSSVFHILSSVSEPTSAEYFRLRAEEEENRSEPLSHARVAKDQPSHRYHEESRRLAALVIRDLGRAVRIVMQSGNPETRKRMMSETVIAKVRRYLRPPNPNDPWWDELQSAPGNIDKNLERAERRTPETISQCIFSPLANVEASRFSSFRIPLGIAIPVELGSNHIWIQGGFGISGGPLTLDRTFSTSRRDQTTAPAGIFAGLQITGNF